MRRPFRALVSFAAGLAVIASAGIAVVTAEQSADAASTTSAAALLKSFDPADIISDEVMFNPGTMTATAIQAFLNAQVPSCRSGYTCLRNYTQTTVTKPADPMCSTYTGAQNETAATIISRVSKACGVNPQVLLVTLEKEQGLITDDWPGARQYRSATGYGCPDTAACDSDFYGFFNQVYKAAWAFKRYTTPKGTTGPGWTQYNWFPVGRPSGVLYNPDASCGARTITIRNKATAVLYYFTPYQPNSAAISAGYGSAPPCGAYGNRNFFLYFTSWFGSTHYAVSGAIGTLWRSIGGSSSSVGNPVANATAVTTAGGGTVQRFTKGTVYSSKAGTFGVAGAGLTEYLVTGGPGGALGWPRTVPQKRSDNGGGVIQAFTNGSIYSSSGAGTHAVTGALYDRYSAEAFQAGRLKWPTADAVTSTANGGGTWQTFTGGRISAAKSAAGVAVTGPLLAKYLARGAEASSLGWPTAAAATTTAHGTSGTIQQFQLGQAQAQGSTVRTVTGNIAKDYAHNGGAAGSLGWATGPAQQSTANGGGWSQTFAGGSILYSAKTGAHPLKGKELAVYTARGGTAGTLGWPGSRTRDTAGHGGAVTAFTNGRLYTSSAGSTTIGTAKAGTVKVGTVKVGTVAVLGDILAKYLAKKGPGGVLGWPTGPAAKVKGVVTQRFEHGSITWTGAGGAGAPRMSIDELQQLQEERDEPGRVGDLPPVGAPHPRNPGHGWIGAAERPIGAHPRSEGQLTPSERPPTEGSPSVVAVVVAYNRRALLLEALAALQAQTAPLTAVVVVDNHSDDDSAEIARSFWPEVELIRLTPQHRGAGGFATGMAVAIARHDPDWVWVMDDDTIPTPTALEALLTAVDRPDVVLAGSRVLWTDGSDHPMNTPRRNPFARRDELQAAAEQGVTAVRSSSFVSMLVSAARVKAAGLPIADYFIWNDDFEFSTRMLRDGRGLYVPDSVVIHKTKALANTDADPGARFYFEVRNKIWLMVFSHGLNPFEKLVYMGSTLLRWARTFRRSRQRRFLLTQLRRGLLAGFGSRPRLNADVLCDLGAVTEAVVKVEAPARRAA